MKMKILILMTIIEIWFVTINCQDFTTPGRLAELEECLSKILIAQHKLETMKENFTDPQQILMVETALAKTYGYEQQIRSLLKDHYLQQGLHTLIPDINKLHELFTKIDSKTTVKTTESSSSHETSSTTTAVPSTSPETSSIVTTTASSSSPETSSTTPVPSTSTETSSPMTTNSPPEYISTRTYTTRTYTTRQGKKCLCTCPLTTTATVTSTGSFPTNGTIICPKVAGLVVRGILIPAIGELTARFGQALVDFIVANANANSVVFRQPHPGAVWISILDGTWGTWVGQICSFYYHPTKTHSATTIGRNGRQRSIADPCRWAISCQTRAWWGNKSFFDTLP